MTFYEFIIVSIIAIIVTLLAILVIGVFDGKKKQKENSHKECLHYSTTYVPIYGKVFYFLPLVMCSEWK